MYMGILDSIQNKYDSTYMSKQYLSEADSTKFNSTGKSTKPNESVFSGNVQQNNDAENISMFGSAKGLAPIVETEARTIGSELGPESKALQGLGRDSKAIAEIGAEAKGASKIGRVLKTTRGAAYTNDLGEGLKPAIGEALAKRCWYPSLLYVGVSVYDKTVHDEHGNKDFSVKRGAQEFAFQTLASLCGPILLVNLGQNTIGKVLTKIGSSIGQIRQGINPLKNISKQAIVSGTKNVAIQTGKGIIDAAKDLPKELWETITLAFKDITHPVSTCKKTGQMFSSLFKSMRKIPAGSKQVYNTFKADKSGFIFGKNGILFGQKGLFGENGLLFGQKSGRILGGLLGILLLYKAVDKAAAWIVGRKEE